MQPPFVLWRRGFPDLTAVIRRVWPDAVWLDSVREDAEHAVTRRVVVVCCDHPDAFRSAAHWIKARAPLAEILIVSGDWDLAAGRTRSHWPAAWRVSEAAAIERLNRLANGHARPQITSVTWTRDERFLQDVREK